MRVDGDAPQPGMTADSRAYVMAARAVADGQGVATRDGNGERAPLTHLAPLYPIVLSAGRDVIAWARLLNTSLFALNIVLAALLVHRATGPVRAAALGAMLMLTSCPLLQAHVMIWSEPPFIGLVLVGVWLLAQFFESRSAAVLALAACAAALAAVTRYCGAAFVVAGGAARAAYWVDVAPPKWLGYGCDRWAQADLVRFASEGRIRATLGLKRCYAGRDGNAWVISSKTRAL